MPALSEYSNVYNSAILIAQAKGYDVWYRKETDQYCAQKDGWDFWASSPCGLLGLIAMFEHISPAEYREHWWQVDGPDLYFENLPTAPPKPYVSVTKQRKGKGPLTRPQQVRHEGWPYCDLPRFRTWFERTSGLGTGLHRENLRTWKSERHTPPHGLLRSSKIGSRRPTGP